MKKLLAVVTLVLFSLSLMAAVAEDTASFPGDIANASTATAERKPYEAYFPRRLMDVDTPVVTGSPATTEWAVAVSEPSAVISEEVAMMGNHVMQQPIVTFFEEAVQAAIEANKPAGVNDIHDLVAYEMAAVISKDYPAGSGDNTAVFEIETEFEPDTELVVMIGLPLEQAAANGDLLSWSVQKTLWNDQKISVVFTEDELTRMGSEPALMVVLGVPAQLGASDDDIANTPSRSYDDMTEITTAQADNWELFVADPSEIIEAEVAAMIKHVADQPIVTFFDAPVQDEIAKTLSAEDAASLIAYELIPLACKGYQPAFNNVAADMTFATLFDENEELIVLIGLPKAEADDGNLLTWTVQRSVQLEGKVRVMFTEEELVQMESTPALLVVLSAPIGE